MFYIRNCLMWILLCSSNFSKFFFTMFTNMEVLLLFVFFLGQNVFSHPLQVCVHNFSQVLSFITISTISSSKKFHHFFQTFLTFFTCYSTRWLLNLLEKKCFLAFTATSCSSLFSMVYHILYVKAQDAC